MSLDERWIIWHKEMVALNRFNLQNFSKNNSQEWSLYNWYRHTEKLLDTSRLKAELGNRLRKLSLYRVIPV